jgi:polysaccharide export outer membrane protein
MRRLALALLAVVTLSACGTASHQAPTMAGTNAGSVPAPAGVGPVAPTSPVMPNDPSGIDTINRRLLGSAPRPPSPAEVQDLPLGPGDLIRVSVFEVPELSDLAVRIPGDGRIKLPLVGPLAIASQTPSQLEGTIRDRLIGMKYMHDPQVTVFVTEQRSQQIAVIGAVRKGGVHPLIGRLRVTDALAMAEGLTEEADHVIQLVRRLPSNEEKVIAIDIDNLDVDSGEKNPLLQAGDVVHVPRAGFYYVGGDVVRPGMLPLRGRTTLDQAITAAGGVKPVADSADIRVYRTSAGGAQEVLTFSLDEIETERQKAPALQKRDLVIVGRSRAKAVTYGILDFLKGVFSVGVGAGL